MEHLARADHKKNHYKEDLFMVGRILVFLVVLVNLCGCAQQFYPVCRHRAIYAAIVAGETYPVRIVRGKSTFQGWHVQAQYWDGEWHWLTVNDFGCVVESDQDGFYPIETWSVDDYYKSRFGILTNIWGYGDLITHNKGS